MRFKLGLYFQPVRVPLFQHHLLRRLSFLYWMPFVLSSKSNWTFLDVSILGFSLLFHIEVFVYTSMKRPPSGHFLDYHSYLGDFNIGYNNLIISNASYFSNAILFIIISSRSSNFRDRVSFCHLGWDAEAQS